MRTAYKVWIAIAAVVFCLVAVVDLSSNKSSTTTASTTTASPVAAAVPTTTTTASSVPPADPAEGRVYDDTAGVEKTVAKVVDFRSVQFNDGTRADLDVPDLTTESWAGCQKKILNAAAHRLLDGKTVTAGHDSSSYSERKDWVRLRGYQDYEPETDYTSALSTETTSKIVGQCYPETTSSGAGSSGGGSVDIDVHRDHGLPDGALTGGFCRKHRWC